MKPFKSNEKQHGVHVEGAKPAEAAFEVPTIFPGQHAGFVNVENTPLGEGVEMPPLPVELTQEQPDVQQAA